MKLFEVFNTVWTEMTTRPDFVRCPCTECGGMVSTRANMVHGAAGWYCTAASRDRIEGRIPAIAHERFRSDA